MIHFRLTMLGVLLALLALPLNAQEAINLTIREVIERPALHFPSGGDTGFVLVHQSGLDAESWAEVATLLQQEGFASFALESTSREDVQSGIAFLEKHGKQRIALIGASIGGAAVQSATSHDKTGVIKLAILLGTARGNMSEDHKTEKLFMVTENDFFSAQTFASFEIAAEPKELLVFPGAAHGQEMFSEEYGADLVRILLKRVGALKQ